MPSAPGTPPAAPPGVGGALPIDPHLPSIADTVVRRGALVLLAEPGAGKTTRVPSALLDAGVLGAGTCLVQEPRRLAARAAARRVAVERGSGLGAEVGYRVRHDQSCGPATRILFVTEGILTRQLQRDPLLEGVAAVVLDEFHERSLEADLGLALLREVRREVRPDLKILVLSATLDPGPVADYLDAAVLTVPGRSHPVDVRYAGRPATAPPGPRVAQAVRRAWPDRPAPDGSVLAFLPGAADIRAAARALGEWAGSEQVPVLPLHGDLPARAQDRVLDPAAGPRVILATDIAETSLTVPGVDTVVDCGLAKQLRFDPGLAMDRLEVVSISRDAADQRAGRAGRTGPGVAWRLWTEHEHRARPAERQPEILRTDLAGAVLELLAWGERTPLEFPWLTPPDPQRVEQALELLQRLGAVDAAQRLTRDGERMRALPLHPRLARLVLEAARGGRLGDGARAAALASERDILRAARTFGEGFLPPSGTSDVLQRLELLEAAEQARFAPATLAALDLDGAAVRTVYRAGRQVERLAGATMEQGAGAPKGTPEREEVLGRALLAAFPDRVGRRRQRASDRFVLVGGRGARLAPTSCVRSDEFVVAVRLDAGRRGQHAESLIRWASGIAPAWLEESGLLTRESRTELAAEPLRVLAVERDCYLDLCLRERPVAPDPEQAARLLAEAVAEDPLRTLGPAPAAERLLARCRFLARVMPELELPEWNTGRWRTVLLGLAAGKTTLAELRRANLATAVQNQLSWRQRQALEDCAPERIQVPSGRAAALEYPPQGPPVLALKIQEAFGWREGPRVAAGRVPVALHLLGPHGRPLQITADLASFWDNTYPEIRKEMRGRYPKHRWPEDPSQAVPSRSSLKKR